MNKKKAFSLIELMLVFAIIGIHLAMSLPNYRRGHIYTQDEMECFSNQRVLYGAIEIYNMENSKKIETAFPGLDYENCEKELLDTKYMKKRLEPSYKGCSYGYISQNGSDTVFCTIHGPVKLKRYDKPVVPEYNKSLEKPFSNSYNNFREEIINKKTKELKFKNFMENTLPKFIASPYYIGFIITFVIIGEIIAFKTKKKKSS